MAWLFNPWGMEGMLMSIPIGPTVKKLMILKTSREAIPKGGNYLDGFKFLSDKERLVRTMKESHQWVLQAIQVVRTAKEPNPFKTADDETIAAEILKKVEEKNEYRNRKTKAD